MNGKILVNRTNVFSSYIVHQNDEITVNLDFDEEDNIIPEDMNLEIIYEDDYLLAVNKPFGTVVHPSSYHPNKTLANGVKFYLSNKKKIRAINRLDRDTSGIVLFAKNEYIQELMIRDKNIKKEYLAIVTGLLPNDKGTINAKISRKEGSIMERCISEEGQIAITHYDVINVIKPCIKLGMTLPSLVLYKANKSIQNIKRYSKTLSLVHLELETGRTHQIRVHLAYIGNSILGDTLYGFKSNLINRQALHAHKMTFLHPITKVETKIVANVPYDMVCVVKEKDLP